MFCQELPFRCQSEDFDSKLQTPRGQSDTVVPARQFGKISKHFTQVQGLLSVSEVTERQTSFQKLRIPNFCSEAF